MNIKIKFKGFFLILSIILFLPFSFHSLTYAASVNYPLNIILPNYDRTLIGQIPSLEAGAFVARTDDSSSNWYNPAGLLHSERTVLNTSSSAYGWTSLQASISTTDIGAVNGNDVPGFFGLVIGKPIFDTNQIRAGFSIARELTWSPTLQSQVTQSPSAGLTQRTNYSVRDNFNQYVPSLSVAYAATERLGLGVSAMITSTSFQGNDTVSVQQTTASTQSNLIRYSQINGNTVNLRLSIGGQYDLSDHWKLGVILRTPSARLWGGSTVTYESILNSGGQSTNSSFFDSDASFSYRESFQTNVGLAYKSEDFEIEGDLRFHAPVATYSLMTSNQAVFTTSNTGGAPTSTSSPATDVTNAFNRVINFAIGGKYQLIPTVGLHGGFFTSYSPVQDSSGTVFRKVDLYGITAGASLLIGSFSGSLGGAYEWGSSDSYPVTDSTLGTPLETTLSVKSIKILYSISFKF